MKVLGFLLTVVVLLFYSCSVPFSRDEKLELLSPDGSLKLVFEVKDGGAYYSLQKGGKGVISASKLGFKIKDQPSLDCGFQLIDQTVNAVDTIWEQPWGEDRFIRNQYNQIAVKLQESGSLNRKINLVFRVFNDGLGFRYEFPQQKNLNEFAVLDEETEFNMFHNNHAWWIPAYKKDRYEYLYKRTLLSKLDTVHTPMTIETTDNLFVSIHEAALYNYGSMTICRKDSTHLKSDITPLADGVKAYLKTPFNTPWRTIIVADKVVKLIESRMMLNLNEPSKIRDTSWIRPSKFMGIWWGMFTGVYTWSSGAKHGATTQNAFNYIDYCAQYGIPALLIEGWNQGWDGNWMNNGKLFNFTKPYSDFEIEKICKYAHSKEVEIVGHHETGADVQNYESQMDSAFAYYHRLGIKYVKTGYVGSQMDHKEWHHSQYGVNHYQRVAELAAKYQIMIDAHEPIKGTGIQRTWPNFMSREGARGMEYEGDAVGGITPEHPTILPFTRILAGGMDYTPGIFDITNPNKRISTTLAKQLAYYVVIYSPIVMAADLPEHYQKQPAFKFIQDVPCDWEKTVGINGAIGDYVTIARKDRKSDDWYLGSITDENARSFVIPLSFLEEGCKYIAEIYADGKNADWVKKPLSLDISNQEVTNKSNLTINLATSGGCAIRFRKIEKKREMINGKVLFVLTNNNKLGSTGKMTGYWKEEVAVPYYTLTDAGIDVDFATIKGGLPPCDPLCSLEKFKTKETERMDNDKIISGKLINTIKVDQINQSAYDAIFFPGGQGPMWDLSEDKSTINLIESFFNNGKTIAFICHGCGVLRHVRNKSGEYLVKGKKVTGFSNSEERSNKSMELVPFLVEDMLKKNGGVFSKSKDGTSHVVVDGYLITGQNPESSQDISVAILKSLKNK